MYHLDISFCNMEDGPLVNHRICHVFGMKNFPARMTLYRAFYLLFRGFPESSRIFRVNRVSNKLS